MLLQGLNLDEYGNESGVTAPQARNLEFLSHGCVEISLFFFLFLFQALGVSFVWGLGGGGK